MQPGGWRRGGATEAERNAYLESNVHVEKLEIVLFVPNSTVR